MLAVITTAAMPHPAGAASSAPISVNVNGAPVNFNGPAPIEQNDAVLVPLRGVFEAMGAGVVYDPATRTISARKGASFVVLPIGSNEATVNGQAQELSQPATVIDGSTFVPLRFVAQALGGYVEWQAANNVVAITTADQHLGALPAPPGTGPVTGQLTGIYTNTNPEQITVRVDGVNTTIPLTSSTAVLRSAPGQPDEQLALDDIPPGNQVTVARNDQGFADTITVTFGEVKGTVKSIAQAADGNNVLTLNDGTTVELAPDARLRMNGRKIALTDIMPDETVVVRTNPGNNFGYAVYVNPGNGPGPTPAPEVSADPSNAPSIPAYNGAPLVNELKIDATRPLHAGDTLTATLTGTPGAKAVMAIPGIADHVDMTETSPGVYTAAYPVPNGIAVEGANVVARLIVGDQRSPLVQASRRIAIDTVIPAVNVTIPEKDSTVENRRPLIYAILSDHGGMGIDTDRTHIFLDGQDLTGSAMITGTMVDLKPQADLAPGAHNVRIALVDKAGNGADEDWSFTVTDHRVVRSFRTDVPAGTIVSAGMPIQFTLEAPAGGTARVTIAGIARDVPLHEREPFTYTGSYVIKPGQNATEAPVIARFVSLAGHETTTLLSAGINVAAGSPESPTITQPGDGAAVTGQLNVAGTAPPDSLVRVKVDYKSTLGGLLPVGGSAGTFEVAADRDGNWSASALPTDFGELFGGDRDTEFIVTASDVDNNGDESPASTVTVDGGRFYAHRRGQDQPAN
jgi:hypothetical protein